LPITSTDDGQLELLLVIENLYFLGIEPEMDSSQEESEGVMLRFFVAALLCSLPPGIVCADNGQPTVPKTIRIAVANSFFGDAEDDVVKALVKPFGAFIMQYLGIPGQTIPGGNASRLGQLLVDGEAHIGILPGVEFAWAREKHNDLKALVIVVNDVHHLHALVVVREDSKLDNFLELRGKDLAFNKNSRPHCQLFLSRRCQEHGDTPEKFFRMLTNPSNNEDAIDDVVDKRVQAAVVDKCSHDSFERRKPARFAQLKVLETSPTFPAAVIAYRAGALPDATLNQIKESLIRAKGAALTLAKITAFEPVPKDYEKLLEGILKTYPPILVQASSK
jgi:ABC-type phosphate/phosphonate transport system substrate-binding protein